MGDASQWSANSHASCDTGLNRLSADEDLKIAAELCPVLGARRFRVRLYGTINYALRERRVHLPARSLRNEDQRIAGLAEVALERSVKLTALCMRRRNGNQRAAGRGEAGPQRFENLLVGIGRVVRPPERYLIANHGDRGNAADGSKGSRAHLVIK